MYASVQLIIKRVLRSVLARVVLRVLLSRHVAARLFAFVCANQAIVANTISLSVRWLDWLRHAYGCWCGVVVYAVVSMGADVMRLLRFGACLVFAIVCGLRVICSC